MANAPAKGFGLTTSIYLVIIFLQFHTSSEINDQVTKKGIIDHTDSEWSVKRLKDTDFIANGQCEKGAQECKAEKYKKVARRDGGAVKWVSSDPVEIGDGGLAAADEAWRAQKDPSRRGDYLISQEEYEDEVQFDPEVECPDVVQVVELQMDQLRNYDLECSKLTEWHSLE